MLPPPVASRSPFVIILPLPVLPILLRFTDLGWPLAEPHFARAVKLLTFDSIARGSDSTPVNYRLCRLSQRARVPGNSQGSQQFVCLISALGHKRTFGKVRLMSALPPKADISSALCDVRFVPKEDSCSAARVASPSALSHGHDYVCLNFGGNLAPSMSIRNHGGGIVRCSF
jgi:hypothetical protein